MAYYKKSHLIEALQPDVILLREVAKKDVLSGDHPSAAWVGSNLNKGGGVLGITKARYRLTEPTDAAIPWHIAFSVDGPNIIALWAHQANRELRYVRVTHEIVDRHASFLAQGLSSVYHREDQTEHGSAPTKTYFHTRNQRFGHHIDYAFLTHGVPASLRVGDAGDWLAHSDHMPLVLDID